MNFDKNLKMYRERAGITRPELASRLNIATNTYGLYETGRSQPNLQTLVKISEILEVSICDLLGVPNYPSKLAKQDLDKLLSDIEYLLDKGAFFYKGEFKDCYSYHSLDELTTRIKEFRARLVDLEMVDFLD